MAILIVEHNGTVEGVPLSGRVLIGWRAGNHVVINDRDVSSIHAWIDTAGRQFCVTDAGSRTGTFVNGMRVAGKIPLRHGDRITVGPAALTFRTDASLSAGVAPRDTGRSHPPGGDVGALPHATSSCGACQSAILPGEDITACPACALTFHPDCWTENYGCAAYGCSQVSALRPHNLAAAVDAVPMDSSSNPPLDLPATEAAQFRDGRVAAQIPGAHVLLGASVVGVLGGAFTFGTPSLLALVAAMVYLKRRPDAPHRGVAWAAAALALAGCAGGAVVSYVWWIGGGRSALP